MSKTSVDTSDFDRRIRAIEFGADDLLHMAGAGSAVLVNGMRMRVPVDTGATRASIKSHIVTSRRTYVEDDVGPETDYAPNIEYGRRDMPNYPIQPYVRPTAYNDFGQVITAISYAFAAAVNAKW